MATVESSDIEVVAELGVPLPIVSTLPVIHGRRKSPGSTHGPASEGVTGSEGGGGRFIRVGCDMALEFLLERCRRAAPQVRWNFLCYSNPRSSCLFDFRAGVVAIEYAARGGNSRICVRTICGDHGIPCVYEREK